MAAPQENLLPLGQLMGTDRNTFTKQRDHRGKNSVNKPMLLQADFSALQSHQNLRVTHLQQRWQELKERELAAQQYNKELLQQFEKAQDTLREMLAHNTAMKTIRMEYERYLKENSPHWQQQLKEKTQAARTLRMGDCLRSCLNTEEHVRKSFAHQHLHSQGPTKKSQNIAATQEYNSQNIQSDNNQDGSSHLPYILSSWLSQPQSHTARFPIGVPYQPQGSSYVPPSYLPPPLLLHPLQPHHLATSTPSHHQLWPRQDASCRASPQADCPWSWTAGAAGPPSGSEALWGQFYMEEPPPESLVSQVVAQEVETSRAASSKSGRSGGSRSSHLSQELDIKPVRLFSGHAENSESGSDSGQIIRERMQRKRDKRGRSQCISSEKERHTSQECLGVCKGEDTGSWNEESQCLSEGSTIENSKKLSADNKSESGTEGSRGTTIQPENGARNEIKKQEIGSSEQNSADEKEEDHEKNPGGGDGEEDNAEEKKDSQTDEELEEEDVEEDDTEEQNSLNEEEQVEQQEEDEISVRKNTFEEEESAAEDEGVEECKDKDRMNENCEKRKQSSASSQDEDELQRDKNKTEEDEEGLNEEEDGEGEQTRVKAGEPEEESDSQDSIISPQENRFKMMHIIPEEAAEDDIENKGSKTASFEDDDSNDFSEDDIENLLAPQEQTKKGEKELKATEKPKAISDSMKIFQVEDEGSTKPNHQSDSDESDHFYD